MIVRVDLRNGSTVARYLSSPFLAESWVPGERSRSSKGLASTASYNWTVFPIRLQQLAGVVLHKLKILCLDIVGWSIRDHLAFKGLNGKILKKG